MLHRPGDDSLFPRLNASTVDTFRQFAEEVVFSDGDLVLQENVSRYDLFIILEGRVNVTRQVGNRREKLASHGPEEFTGDLSLLLCERSSIRVEAVGKCRALRIKASTVRSLIGSCSPLAHELLEAMSSQSRDAERQLRRHEKMMALGKLAAGVAHELDNPAAALARSGEALQLCGKFLERMAGIPASPEQADLLSAVLSKMEQGPLQSGVDLADREEKLAAWLEIQGVEENWFIAGTLAERHISAEDMDAVLGVLPEAEVRCFCERLLTTLYLGRCGDTIRSTSRHISRVIGMMKQHTGMDRSERIEVNVHDGIDSSIRFMTGKERDQVQVRREYQPNLLSLVANPAELNQVWSNLIENALEAMQSKGTLCIRTEQDRDEIIVHVADSGCGINEADLPRIFEPFFTTKPVGTGLGLGLDVAYDIVTNRYGGRIFVESEPGNTRFEVRLPLAEA